MFVYSNDDYVPSLLVLPLQLHLAILKINTPFQKGRQRRTKMFVTNEVLLLSAVTWNPENWRRNLLEHRSAMFLSLKREAKNRHQREQLGILPSELRRNEDEHFIRYQLLLRSL